VEFVMLNNFEINLIGLKEGMHEFDYQIDASFFEAFDQEILDKGGLKVHLTLHKKESFLELLFGIAGSIELVCDRSLEVFDHPLRLQEKMILKFGEEAEVISEEMEVISFGTQSINVARYIFDFISVAVPMKRIHPKYAGDEPMQYTSATENPSKQQSDSEEIDPRWKELLKLKNK
jgi:uncharacterized protein